MLKIGIAGNTAIYEIVGVLYRLFAINETLEGTKTGSLPEIHIFCNEFPEKKPILSDEYFDLLIINNRCDDFPVGKILIINSDEKGIIEALQVPTQSVITYGFNSKACVTASSLTEESRLICVQRGFRTLRGNVTVQQEFTIGKGGTTRSFESEGQTYSLLAAVAAALICDIPISIIEKLY